MTAIAQTMEDMQAEIARLRAELQNAAKAALDAVALSCEKEREADALRAEVEHLTEALRCRTIDWNEACNSRESWTEKAKAARAEADALRMDAERYRWLCEDHSDAATRRRRNDLLEYFRVRSYSANSTAIDAAIAMGASA